MVKKTKGKRNTTSYILSFLVYLSVVLTFIFLIWVVGDVVIKGVPSLKPSQFEWKYTTDNVSMMPSIINTLEMVVITLIIAVPIGILSGIYMVEYAKADNRFFKLVNLMVETLQGIPSIIYGLFGYLFFGNVFGLKYTILSGALTMSIMVLPLIITSTVESLKSVPNSLREASYGLGAKKLRTVFNVVLPSASMGIFSGIVLAVGRVFGETAALMFTSGSMGNIAGPLQSGRTMAIHMYTLQSESLHLNESYATAFVLILVVVFINAVSETLSKKLEKENVNG